MKNVLVTGGLGFVGSNLVDRLLALDRYKITVIDDLSSGKIEYGREEVTYYYDDFKKVLKDNLLEEKIDIIFHLAAEARIQPSFEDPLYTCENNSYGTAVVCEYARRHDCKVVYAGSSSFYAGPYLNPYAFAKWQGEEVCRMYSEVYGLHTGIGRFFNVYGPRNPSIGQYTPVIAIFEEQSRAGDTLTIVGDGEQRRDFTHVYDIADGLIAISKGLWTGDVFNLGTGTNYSINEVAALFGGETLHLPPRKGEARNTQADISKTTNLTGWVPRYNLKDYVKGLKNEII
jgi:UDP-glucose 4-epimerase